MSHPTVDPRPWLVLYDNDCGFCRWSLGVVLRADRDHLLRPVSLQSTEAQRLLSEMSPEQRMASWHLVAPDGSRWSAGAALPVLAELLPPFRPLAPALRRIPRLDERGYRWVAEHRSWFGKVIPDAAKQRADRLIAERAGQVKGPRSAA